MYRPARELPMDPVGDERSKGSEQPARDGDDLVQRRERGAVIRALDVVEAVAALAHIPLRHVLVEEAHHRFRGVGGLVAAKQLVGFALHGGKPRQNPSVKERTILWRRILVGWRPAEVRVLRENAGIDVLEREQEAARGIADPRLVEAARGPELARRREESRTASAP